MSRLQPILLIEDDLVDIMTVRRGFKEIGVLNTLIETHDGEEALDYLNSPVEGLPCVILLDINMPKMNGKEFMIALRNINNLTLVIVLTSNNLITDKEELFDLDIDDYMTKPFELKEIDMRIKAILKRKIKKDKEYTL